ncbi:contact-dependent growth inhibition system immunity protein [uncultured Tenacibaculum sp.]|uniref:contact-dependent growth inhibition system immunity protein n=1 Tax=uncultured Tenacibaculum sp. TaxID=174713 RepID=UPI00261FD499|nr:contact-dependent growth inhibition system immunity protein [uncultured Tenacibaculum sp.]
MENKSIEQLEKNIWKNPSEFPTDLVEKCYRYRKISIAELTNEQIRLLISQQIGVEYLIGIALEKLELNILTECDFYEGDLLVAVSSLPTEFWNENQTEFLTFNNIVERNSELIKNELGEKKFDRINEKIKTNWQHIKK